MNMDDNYLDFEEPTPEKKDNKKVIIIAAVAIVLCCCCAFVLSGYLWWGDMLMDALGFLN
jgi:fatty acid desaturase